MTLHSIGCAQEAHAWCQDLAGDQRALWLSQTRLGPWSLAVYGHLVAATVGSSES